MGWIDNLFGRRTVVTSGSDEPIERSNVNVDKPRVAVGATDDGDSHITSYDNSNITFQGELAGFDYDKILRDKQGNIVDIYKLADYYCDADPIIHGVIHNCYVPFCSSSGWYLTNAKDKTIKKFNEYYEKIRLREKLEEIFMQMAKYGQCFIYILDGNIVTLPPHKIKIGNTTLNGKPILELNVSGIKNEWKQKGYTIKENWIKDNQLEYMFKGYPKEVVTVLNKGDADYAQLDPDYAYALQMPKEGWLRYAVPFIVPALGALARKELIKNYEKSLLNIGSRSFVHVRYGDEKKGADILPDRNELIAVRSLFRSAMSGKVPLVVTNQLAKAELISSDLSDLYQWPIYSSVDKEILAAAGISGIIVEGTSDEGSSFSTAQISMQTLESRIDAMRKEFCEFMDRLNARATEYIDGTYNLKETPRFHFEPLSMAGKAQLREACFKLWSEGVVATRTMMEAHGFSMDDEIAKRKAEASSGADEILCPRETTNQVNMPDELKMPTTNTTTTKKETTETKETKEGRPEKDDSQRMSDPASSESSKMPKPSNPNGSGDYKI